LVYTKQLYHELSDTGDRSTTELLRNGSVLAEQKDNIRYLLKIKSTVEHSTVSRMIGGMYIKVRVTAGAKRELVEKVSFDHYDISVREPAERNMANTRIRELVAHELGVPLGKVRIISGHHSGSKMLSVDVQEQ
jgi:uncharacterized protein YggU (UPF0235/DUF167 family)